MKRIFTYDVPANGIEIKVAAGRVLAVNDARDGINVSVESEDNNAEEPMTMMVVSTGYGYSDEWFAVGTAISPEGYCWHVIVKVEPHKGFLKR